MSAGATKSPICKLDPTAIPRLRPILFFIAINTAVECAKIPASQHKGELTKIFLFNFRRWLFTLSWYVSMQLQNTGVCSCSASFTF
jgi:hypothetical protein